VAERYSFRGIWDDLALPELACSFKLAVGPAKMVLAFCGVFAICILGFLMDRCSRRVVIDAASGASLVRTELNIYLDRTPKEARQFIKDTEINDDIQRQGVFSTLWSFFAGRFHDAATKLLNLSDSNIYSNIKNVLDNVWQCIRAIGWAFQFHPVYSSIFFTISFLISVFVGGAICRCAALEYAKAERPGIFEAVEYAKQNFRAFLTAPLLPLGMVGVFAFVVILLGMLTTIPYIGDLLMVVLFGFVLFFGFLVTLMAFGALSGGMLLFPSIAYEKTTGTDSIGRAFNYVLKQPSWMIYYVLVSGGLGTFFYLVLRLLIFLALRLTYGLLFVGMSIAKQGEKLEHIWPEPSILSFVNTATDPARWSESLLASIIHLFMLGIIGILLSYIASYFFCSSTVIYALMRKKVDKKEIEQIYVHLEHVETD